MDDPGPERKGPVRRLPLQCHRWQLGEEAARLGHADGEFAHGGRHQDARGSGAGPVPGSGSGEDEEENRGGGEGGGAMPSTQWTQLFPGEWEVSGAQSFSVCCFFHFSTPFQIFVIL